MARPAHPSSHDERLQNLIDQATEDEVLIPCPDIPSTKLIRSRIRELIRAYKEWELPEYSRYRRIKTKIQHTHRVLPVRPNYDADDTRSPFTLVLDSRDVMDEVLAGATSTSAPVPLTRSPNGSRSDYAETIIDDDDDDETAPEDDYDALISRYAKKSGGII